jgi:glycosyltransferase involved in cell wall biosynthesis
MSATAAVSSPAVLLVSNFLSGWDGRRTYAEDLAARLEEAGIRVRRSSRVAFKPARLADMVLAAAGAKGGYELAVIDVYSGQAFFWAEAAARAARLAGKQIVLVLHGGRLPEFAAKHERRVAALLAAANAVIAPSPYLQEAFRRLRPDIRVLPNAVDLRAYPCRIREQACPRLVWLRSFHQIYNPAMAIEVLAQVRRRHREATLVMYGPDKDGSLASCRQRAAGLGVADAVRFAGVVPKEQVGRALAEADIFLNTANIDNTPVSVIEAMACGLCVVSTDAGGVPCLVGDGREGLLVRPGDADGMAEAVLRLLEDPPLCRRLSAAAREKAEEFGWESILPRWMDLLGSLRPAREVRP